MRYQSSFALRARLALLLVGSFTVVSPVLAQNETESTKTQTVNEQSADSLKIIGLALQQYLQDWDEKFPPMNSAQNLDEIEKAGGPNWEIADASNVQQALYPYLKTVKIFANPVTGEIYRSNSKLSGRSTFDFKDRAPIVIITFYETSPADDGTRAVLYLDGHVIRERETDWPRILAASDAITKNHDNDGKYAPDMSVLVPKVKTALGANRALLGSQINVDGRAKTITLKGNVTSAAQKNLAIKIAGENAPGINLVIDLK